MPETLTDTLTDTGPISGPGARPESVEHANRERARREALYRKVEAMISQVLRLYAHCPRHGCRRHRVCLHTVAPDGRYHGPRPPCRLGDEASAAYERARRHVVAIAAQPLPRRKGRGGSR